MLLPSGNPFKCHKEVLYFQLLIPPKRFDIFPPRLGDAQKVQVHSDFSLKTNKVTPEKDMMITTVLQHYCCTININRSRRGKAGELAYTTLCMNVRIVIT